MDEMKTKEREIVAKRMSSVVSYRRQKQKENMNVKMVLSWTIIQNVTLWV